jgi:hypothetical protein
MTPRRSSMPGGTAALIVVPSLISGVGVAFVLVAILLNQRILQDIFLVAGVILLWLDFFVTAAIWRYSMRSMDQRMARLEAGLISVKNPSLRQFPSAGQASNESRDERENREASK